MNKMQILENVKFIEVITRNVYHVWVNDNDWYEFRRGEYGFDELEKNEKGQEKGKVKIRIRK